MHPFFMTIAGRVDAVAEVRTGEFTSPMAETGQGAGSSSWSTARMVARSEGLNG
jgi:hypothetical protein